MARPQAKIKLGHFPLPPPVASVIARYLRALRRDACFRVLDPCAGDGTALRIIVDALRAQHEREYSRFADFEVSTYGIEPQATLAQAAAERLTHVLHTSFFSTTLSNGDSTDGGWQFAYVNSDFDEDSEQLNTRGRKYRLEFTFLQRATLKLCANGILVWVIPHYVLRRPGVAKFLAEHFYDDMYCVRFPDEKWRPPESREEVSMYGQFKQVVLFLRKRPQPVPAEHRLMARVEEWANMGSLLPVIGTEERLPLFAIPDAPAALRYFTSGAFDPDAVARQVGTFSAKTRRPELGAWASDDYWSARVPSSREAGLMVGHPIHKFKKGYVVVFAVAGLANRAVLTGKDGRRVLVKGHTRKTTHYNKTEDESEIVEKITDKFESALWCTDLDTGDLLLVQTGGATFVPWAVEYTTLSMAEFLDNFGGSLMQQVAKLNAPRYEHVTQVPWAKKALRLLKRQPLGKQYDTILAQVHAFVNVWKEGGMDEDELLDRIAEVAEMASGKTFMAIATAFLSDLHACGCTELATKVTRLLPFFPAVVLSPPIMARKWKREIEATIPDARVVIVERFGPSRDSDDDEDEEEEDTSPEEKRSWSDASADFRAFDPDFTGSSLGTIGSVDRIVTRITHELQEWENARLQVEEENRRARQTLKGQELESALKPLPHKPCHVVIVTFSTAKLTPEWGVQYALKPARYIEKQSGLVKLLKRANGQPAMVPCCPNCSRTLLDGRSVRQQLKYTREYVERLVTLEKLREQRQSQGRRSGNRLNGYEQRVKEYLYSLDAYRTLLEQRDTLREGRAPFDARYVASEQRVEAFLRQLQITNAEYRLLLEDRERARGELDVAKQRVQEALPDTNEYRAARSAQKAVESRLADAEKALRQFLHRLLLRSKQYRALLIAQDQLFRELQLACEQRIEAYLRELAASDSGYRELLKEGETIRAAVWQYEHRIALHEEEVVHPISLVMAEKDLVGAKDHRVKRSCPECGEPLWQYTAKRQKRWLPFSVQRFLPATAVHRRAGSAALVQHVGSKHAVALPLPGRDFLPPCVRNTYKRRYPIGDYIRKFYPGFFKLLIADEVHEGADGTALDFARQSLANACGHMLGLTGTLSNGYSSSLFRLFYLLLKGIRQEYQYEDTARWIDENGKRQMVQKSYKEEEEAGTGSDSKRKIRQGMPVYKEIAGVAPPCLGRVARCSTFTELRDVVPNLVKYREEVRVVSMGPELGPEYAAFETESTRNLGKMLSSGDKSGLSPWFYGMLYYPNMPWLGWECRTKHGLVFGRAPALSKDTIYPLERSLIDYVQEQQDKGLPVLVFSENTGVYDVQPRLKELLETKVRKRGGKKLKVVILRSNSTKKTMDREEWLNRQVKAGVDVLICNPRLVKVGLDLIAFPRIAYMSFPRSTSDLRQSARRSLRPMQTVDVEVVFFAYKSSMALRLLHLMARKTQASLLVEGQVASGGLVSLGLEDEMEEGDIIGQMAREMVGALERGEVVDPEKEALELQEMFRAAAELEQQNNQVVDDESQLPPVQMEGIRQLPLSASASLSDAPSEGADPETPPSPDAGSVTEVVTAIPISVTDDPWAEPIVASAALDAWAALRQLYGGGSRRKSRRKS